jgi:hypothetical protein
MLSVPLEVPFEDPLEFFLLQDEMNIIVIKRRK